MWAFADIYCTFGIWDVITSLELSTGIETRSLAVKGVFQSQTWMAYPWNMPYRFDLWRYDPGIQTDHQNERGCSDLISSIYKGTSAHPYARLCLVLQLSPSHSSFIWTAALFK